MSTPAPTPTPRRGTRKKERTRRELLVAAIDAIAAEGEAVTVLDVTRRAEVSNGTFYNYFADREALIDAVIDEVVGTFTTTMAEIVEHEDPALRFATITALLFEHAAAFPQLATVMLRLDAMRRPETWREAPLRPLGDDLAQGALTGRFDREPSAAVVDLVTGTMFRALRRIASDEHDATAEHRSEVIALLLRGLGLDPDEAETLSAVAVAAAPDIHRAHVDRALDPVLAQAAPSTPSAPGADR
ncbi:MAG: TetR/AcrR family transcriptional regulator [Actinomycetota bacterium]